MNHRPRLHPASAAPTGHAELRRASPRRDAACRHPTRRRRGGIFRRRPHLAGIARPCAHRSARCHRGISRCHRGISRSRAHRSARRGRRCARRVRDADSARAVGNVWRWPGARLPPPARRARVRGRVLAGDLRAARHSERATRTRHRTRNRSRAVPATPLPSRQPHPHLPRPTCACTLDPFSSTPSPCPLRPPPPSTLPMAATGALPAPTPGLSLTLTSHWRSRCSA